MKKIGERIEAHADPEAAEEKLRAALERERRRAWDAREFTISPDGTGRYLIRGYTTAEGAEIIHAVLDPLN